MEKMNTAELTETVKRYFVVNEQKKAAAAEAKELGEEIKVAMGEGEISEFNADGIVAKISVRTTKSLDVDALMTWVAKKGLKIPPTCYVTKMIPTLTVKATAVVAQVA